jgi:Tol biopolymer transport system component
LPTSTATSTPTPTPIGSGSGQIVYWVEEENQTGNSDLDGSFYSIGFFDLPSGERFTVLDSDGETVSYFLSSVDSDGRLIYYSRSEFFESANTITYNSLMYSYDLVTGQINQISLFPEVDDFELIDVVDNVIYESWPDISADKNSLLFQSNRDNLTSSTYQDYLYTLNLEDDSIELLSDEDENPLRARFSPNGAKIAFNVWDGSDWEIFVMNVDGTVRTQITDNDAADRYPEWSPDSTRLVYHSDENGDFDLYEYELSTYETTRLTTNDADDVSGCYSPDGDFILFVSDRGDNADIYIYDRDSEEETLILDLDAPLGVPLWVP